MTEACHKCIKSYPTHEDLHIDNRHSINFKMTCIIPELSWDDVITEPGSTKKQMGTGKFDTQERLKFMILANPGSAGTQNEPHASPLLWFLGSKSQSSNL